MKKISRLIGALFAVGVFALPLASCSSSSSTDTTVPVGKVELTPASRLIDVRSAEEFAEGYITGAENINLENGDLERALASLDKDAAYSVYCRSGRRSAEAKALMDAAGFSNVTDLGGIDQAAQTLALPITNK